MSDIKKLTKKIIAFRDARDWKQFHTPKDLAIALTMEASEVAEHFLWKNNKEMKKYIKEHRDLISQELSDVLYWVLLMAHDLGIDMVKATERKMKINETKYPLKKARGKHLKYTTLFGLTPTIPDKFSKVMEIIQAKGHRGRTRAKKSYPH